jgi:hypothetical protein
VLRRLGSRPLGRKAGRFNGIGRLRGGLEALESARASSKFSCDIAGPASPLGTFAVWVCPTEYRLSPANPERCRKTKGRNPRAPALSCTTGSPAYRSDGTFTCEEIGEISIVGPKPAEATGGFTSTGETVITLSISGTATFDGETFSFAKSYGNKAGLESFTCTQHFEEDGNVSDLTVVVAVVPPR